ncbi:efflux RND transporter permease subunit [Desulfovirgula thermocuniculi]|uniref:efflux RND transporter permease subunit n=1 Tax=Desulfovirgula thermocuniculi TaxID=348842 RepID=UPI00040BBC9C|nr:efflux RND transporter permease subunit [Desulfovirgula thermocuniculi]
MRLADFSVERPVAITMLIVALVILGFVSLTYLSIDLLPDIYNPYIMVRVSYPGAGPQEVENDVVRVLEGALGSVNNIEKITSTCQTGSARVTLQFRWGTNLDTALSDVRAAIDRVRTRLPDSAQDIGIFRFNPNMMPILRINLTGDYAPEDLKRLVDDVIAPRLERQDGVASVSVFGGRERELQVVVDPQKLSGYGIALNTLAQTLSAENVDAPGGIIPRGQTNFVVRALGRYRTPQDLENLPVPLPQGGFVRLREVAEVRDTFARQDTFALLNGRPSVSIMVFKQSGANTVDVAERVKKELSRVCRELPGNLAVHYAFDQADSIGRSIRQLVRDSILGGLLAILVLFVFLRNVSTTLVIALAIPFAINTTFILLYFNKLTLNLMSLGGLSLGLGHMIDYSIVVLEAIYRYRQKGYGPKEAAKGGTAEVAMAVIASALTVAVVFLPVVFVQGLAAQFFKQFALTVAFSQLAALFVSLTLIPMLASRLFAEVRDLGEGGRWWNRVFKKSEQWYGALDSFYRRVLAASLRRRALLLGAVALLLGASVCLIPLIGRELFPPEDSGQLTVDVQMPVGTVLSETQAVLEKMAATVAQIPEVQTVAITVGGGAGGYMGAPQTEQGSLAVRLKPKEERRRTTDQVVEEVRSKTRGIPGATVRVAASSSSLGMLSRAFSGRPIEIAVKGSDLDTLRRLAAQVTEIVRSVPGTRQVMNSMEAGRPELRLVVDREKAAQYGLTASQVGNLARILGDGLVVGTIEDESGKSVNIRLLVAEQYRQSTFDLEKLVVSASGGTRVPLKQIARFEEGEGPNVINRDGQSRVVYVYGDYAGRDLGSINREIAQKLAALPLPEGYYLHQGGQQEDMAQTFRSLLIALTLAVMLVYMVMAAQFESLVHPLVIMFSVPLSITGVVLSLLLTGRTFNMMSYVGVIMMVGIVVNNAIVLVDYINTLRRRGLPRDEAILEAGPVRLRPILMTALTTIFALIPLSLALGESSEAQAAMATVVIGGLTFSTFLTLVVVPVVYALFDDLGQRLFGARKAAKEVPAGMP